MESVIKEIITIRQGRPVIPDRSNTNRYCVVTYERDGSRTAYCFGVPVYSDKTGRLVNLNFEEKGNIFYTYGSSSDITAGEDSPKNGEGLALDTLSSHPSVPDSANTKGMGTITLKNCMGYCRALFLENSFKKYGRGIRSGSTEIYPTLNGVLVVSDIRQSEAFTFILSSQLSHLSVRANSCSFSLMRKEFTPFVTVSSVGILSDSGKSVSPVLVGYQKINDREYQIGILPYGDERGRLVFEINMYEHKLIQDTTVESANPYENNAFGGTAFIGSTKEYGEQWLYSRADIDKISVFVGRTINRAVLHIPRLCGELSLKALHLTKRFCSFGANWDNKITDSDASTEAGLYKDYYTVDMTDIISSGTPRTIMKSEGLILKPPSETGGFTAIATGDSYYMPQVLEINFK